MKKATVVFALIVILIGALFTLTAVLTCESPDLEVSLLGFVRLRCTDAASWLGSPFSGAHWRMSFNVFLCFPWPVIVLITAVAHWWKRRE